MLLAHDIDLLGAVDFEVTNHSSAMKSRERTHKPSKICIDWSGNEMNASEYAAYLERGKTGCHLFIDSGGETYQFADLWTEAVTRSNALMDADAIWIVLQNKGVPPEDARVKRGVFIYDFGRFTGPALGVTADQLEELESILGVICACLGIPPCLPRKEEEVIRKQLSTRVLKEWNGILLASHIAPTMSPGPGVLDALDEFEAECFSEDDEDLDDEDETDFDGEEQEVDEEAFEADFPDPS